MVRERKMHFTKCALLMQDLLAAKRDLRLSREIKRLGRYDGLIIDDLGYLQQSRDDMEVVFTLLAERYERGSVLMTSNLPFSKWEAIFKDAMMTAAAIDRLVHHSVIIELNIPSYRVEHAQEKSAGGKPGGGRMKWRLARKRKKGRTESCGNDGSVETVESQRQASPCFHRPLEISPRAGEIPTFPQLRRRGGWKSGKPKTGFPLSHRHLFSPKQKTGDRRAGFALRPGMALRATQESKSKCR